MQTIKKKIIRVILHFFKFVDVWNPNYIQIISYFFFVKVQVQNYPFFVFSVEIRNQNIIIIFLFLTKICNRNNLPCFILLKSGTKITLYVFFSAPKFTDFFSPKFGSEISLYYFSSRDLEPKRSSTLSN